MRIISGLAKGRKILSPEGFGTTRPTLDRIKESIFDIIQNYTMGAVVLDMFSGTGSLGLEAASRGAKECHLVDKSPDTYKYLKQNVENLKFENCCRTYNMDSYKALKMFKERELQFDMIFIDPPYLKDMIPTAVEIIVENSLLKEKGIIISKIDSKEVIYQGTDSIELYDHRRYGNTTICLYRHKEA